MNCIPVPLTPDLIVPPHVVKTKVSKSEQALAEHRIIVSLEAKIEVVKLNDKTDERYP